MEDYDEYFKHAKLLTELHAKPKQLKIVESNIAKQKSNVEEEKEKVEGANKKQNAANKKKWMKRI